MKPLLEMQFIRSSSQFKCQLSIEQAFPFSWTLSLSLQSKYPRNRGGAWLCAAGGSLQSNPAGWGRGLFPLTPSDPEPLPPKQREDSFKKVKPPHPADGVSLFLFPLKGWPWHHTCLSAPLFIGWTVTRWLQQPVRVTPTSQGFSEACFCTLVLVHPQSLGWMQMAPSHFRTACPKVMPPAPQNPRRCLCQQIIQINTSPSPFALATAVLDSQF